MCNHPDLLEPRPVESPFLINPLKIHLPRLLISILSHDLARGYTGPVWQKLPITGMNQGLCNITYVFGPMTIEDYLTNYFSY